MSGFYWRTYLYSLSINMLEIIELKNSGQNEYKIYLRCPKIAKNLAYFLYN